MKTTVLYMAATIAATMGSSVMHAQTVMGVQRIHTAGAAPIMVFQPGARVRILADGYGRDRIVGTITAMTPDSIVLDTADVWAQQRVLNPAPIIVDEFRHMSLDVAQVDSVEVSTGRSRLRGAVKGMLRGAIIGGLYVGFSAMSGRRNPNFRMFMGGFGQGVALGGAIGAPVGSVFASERWSPVDFSRDAFRARAGQIMAGAHRAAEAAANAVGAGEHRP